MGSDISHRTFILLKSYGKKIVVTMEGMQQVLEDIRDLLAPKENFSIVVTSSGTDWTTHFSPPLYLNPKRRYELALVNLETYNSIPNITEANNHFVYSSNGTT